MAKLEDIKVSIENDLTDLIGKMKCCGNCMHNDWEQNICPHFDGPVPSGYFCDKWEFDELSITDRKEIKFVRS